MNASILNYYDLKDESLEMIEYPDKDVVPQLLMEVNYIDNKKIPSMIGNINREFTYLVNGTYMGPLDIKNEKNLIKKYINTVTDIHISYKVKTYIPFYYNNNFECFFWVIFPNLEYKTKL
jgi:hypothetical protein